MSLARAICRAVRFALAASCAFGGVVLVSPRAQSAEPVHVSLDYAPAPDAWGCLGADRLRRAVERRLGREVFVTELAADVHARVRVQREGGGFAASIELFDAAHRSLGRRELSSAARHCSALDDPLALVLSLAADMPRETLGPVTPAPASTEAPATAGTEVPRPAPPRPSLGTRLSIPDEPPRLELHVEPELGLAIASGLLPSAPALGFDVGLTLRSNRFWPVSVHGGGWAPQQQEVGEGRAARFSAQTLSLAICPWTGRVGALQTSVCSLERLARVTARGIGFDAPQRSTGWHVALGAGAGARYPFGRVFLSGSVELLVPLLRRRYFFTDVDDITIHNEDWVQGVLRLGVGVEM